LAASPSKIHCSNGLLTIGKRVLGLLQLNGLSLVANPPAKITAFRYVTLMKYTINKFLYKQIWKNASMLTACMF
jgi:hypothetical protein